jgi:hypothetical protein
MTRMALLVELDPKELAVRLGEAITLVIRPPGMSADQALRGVDADAREAFLRGAEAAIAYFMAQTRGQGKPQ